MKIVDDIPTINALCPPWQPSTLAACTRDRFLSSFHASSWDRRLSGLRIDRHRFLIAAAFNGNGTATVRLPVVVELNVTVRPQRGRDQGGVVGRRAERHGIRLAGSIQIG